MRTATSLSAAAVAAFALPALAQDTTAPEPPTADTAAATTLTAEQQAAYDAWPPAQQASYDAWPIDTRTYFWTLTPERQALFWRISDTNKVTLAGLPAAEQEQAWTQIETQAAAMDTGVSESATEPAPQEPAATEEDPIEEPM